MNVLIRIYLMIDFINKEKTKAMIECKTPLI